MATKNCLHCGSEFNAKRDNALFCCSLHRAAYYQQNKQAEPTVDLNALRDKIARHREEGEKIISHFKKMEDYYSDWENRLVEIENEIDNAEETLGLTKKEITEYDATADLI